MYLIVLNVAVVLIVVVLAWLWSARGFFSALLHMTCVIAAGAIAFAFWETVSQFILTELGDTGFIAQAAWGLGLVLPFSLSLAVLTGLVNLAIRANAQSDPASNLVGGLLCGGVSGFITVGIMLVGFAHLGGRWNSESALIGFDKSGSLVRTGSLWVPADRIVGGLYAHLSETTFRVNEPLARWYPDLADRGHMRAVAPDQAPTKFNARPGDAEIAGRYVVGPAGGLKRDDLLVDKFLPFPPQKPRTLENEEYPPGQYNLHGVVIRAKAGMKEKAGQVVFGPGHVLLLTGDSAGQFTQIVQPIAMISQAKGDSLALGRWRFDGDKVFLTSVGAAADPASAFEFLVPANQTPLAVFVKGQRLDLRDPKTGQVPPPTVSFPTVAARDAAIADRSIITEAGSAPIDLSSAKMTDIKVAPGGQTPVSLSNTLPFRLNRGNLRGLRIDDEKRITDGDAVFRLADLLDRGTDRDLIVERFAVDPSTVIVQVNAGGADSAFSLISPLISDQDKPPALIDNLDQRYEPVGFIYRDASIIRVRYTPGRPIFSLRDLPSMSRSRSDQELTLIYRVSFNVTLKTYAVGTRGVAEFGRDGLKVDSQQK